MNTIRTGDIVADGKNATLLNQLFGTEYKVWMKATYPLKVGEFIWMAVLDGKVRNGWTNIMGNGKIIERYVGSKPYPNNINVGLEVKRRAVFEKFPGKYFIFRGIFELKELDSTLTHRVLVKKADEITL